MNEEITLTQGNKQIKLPLKNLLRLTFVYLQKNLPEYYESTKESSVKDYFNWLAQKLELKKGDAVLL